MISAVTLAVAPTVSFFSSSWTSPSTEPSMTRSSLPEISPLTCKLAPSRAVARSAVAPSGRIASVLIALVPSQVAGAGFGGWFAGRFRISGCAAGGPSGFLLPHIGPPKGQDTPDFPAGGIETLVRDWNSGKWCVGALCLRVTSTFSMAGERNPGDRNNRRRPDLDPSGSGFFRNGLESHEVVMKTGRVGSEQLLDAVGAGGAQDEAGVMMLFDAQDDFRIGVGGSIRVGLAREAEYGAGVLLADGRKLIGLLARAELKFGPFAPEIDAGGGLDNVRDVSAAHASGDFNEIELAIGVGFQKLGMSNTTNQAEGADEIAVHIEESARISRKGRKRPRGEDTAGVGNVERGGAIGVGFSEKDFALGNDAVHVEDLSGNELFEQIEGLLVAELAEQVQEFLGAMNFFHADTGGLGTRLQKPGCRHASHVVSQLLVV